MAIGQEMVVEVVPAGRSPGSTQTAQKNTIGSHLFGSQTFFRSQIPCHGSSKGAGYVVSV
jgi:hypothetical protein